mmetsp:Transcript_41632/g.43596  ORF Transcript_41632/g.43596 Transcript_41632/m.43596 type:complete len:122 (+) Transcript_41632:197-562(+)
MPSKSSMVEANQVITKITACHSKALLLKTPAKFKIAKTTRPVTQITLSTCPLVSGASYSNSTVTSKMARRFEMKNKATKATCRTKPDPIIIIACPKAIEKAPRAAALRDQFTNLCLLVSVL